MTTPQGAHLRVGHVERDRAVDALREAAAQGRLTLGELDARIEAALAARTRGDLRTLLVDLIPPTELELAVNPTAVAAVAGPGMTWQDPLVLTARWDDVYRAGPWEVPPFLELHPVAADVKLNLVDARVASEIIDVHLIGGAGSVVLVVPEGWGAELSRVTAGLGSMKSTVPERPTGRSPLLVLRGRTGLGSLRVRHPNGFDRWARERRLARGRGIVARN